MQAEECVPEPNASVYFISPKDNYVSKSSEVKIVFGIKNFDILQLVLLVAILDIIILLLMLDYQTYQGPYQVQRIIFILERVRQKQLLV